LTISEANPQSNTTTVNQKVNKPHLWQPGQSGNPNGRPKGSVSLVGRLREHLEAHPEDVATIIKQFVELGKRPNLSQLSAIDKLMDRIDGKVAETHKIEGDLPIRLVFVPASQVLNERAPNQNLGTSTSPPLLSDGQEGINP